MKYNIKIILLISAVCAMLVFNFGFLPGILRRAPEPAGIKTVTQRNMLQTDSGGQSISVQAPSIDDGFQNTVIPEPAASPQQDDPQSETPPASGSERTDQAPAPTPAPASIRTEPPPAPVTSTATEPAPEQTADVPSFDTAAGRSLDDTGTENYIITEEKAISLALEYYPGLDIENDSVVDEHKEMIINGQPEQYAVREHIHTDLYEVIFIDASIYGDAYWLVVFTRDVLGEKRLQIPENMSASEFLRVNIKDDIETERYRKSMIETTDDGNNILIVTYSYTERLWAEINAMTGAIMDSSDVGRNVASHFSEIVLPTNYISPPGYP